MTLLTKIATNYFICAWVCMVVSSIFAISGLFMDSVYYPKWITTEVVVVFFVIFSVPFFLKKRISWRLVYKQICRFTNFIVFLEALFAIIQYTDLYTVNMGYSVGTFNNLAGLVACISISFPMGLVFLDEYGKSTLLSKEMPYMKRLNYILITIWIYLNNNIQSQFLTIEEKKKKIISEKLNIMGKKILEKIKKIPNLFI